MELSKDWGSTTTWLAFGNLAASTFLLFQQLISATDWLVINGIGSAGVSGKGILKVAKKNGAPPQP